MRTINPTSIYRFYKPAKENFDTLEKSQLCLFSAKKWEPDTEMEFDFDLSDQTKLEAFVKEELRRKMALPKDSDEYQKFFVARFNILKKHGKESVIGSDLELDHLTLHVLESINSGNGQDLRKDLIRNSFFTRTGICCFTADPSAVSETLFWDGFAAASTGFCVEYDWQVLQEHFHKNARGIKGDYIKYYEVATRPKLILANDYSQEVMDNYCDIIFSLEQFLHDEKEFRLARVSREDLKEDDEKRSEPIPVKAVKRIICGKNMNAGDEKRLREIAVKPSRMQW